MLYIVCVRADTQIICYRPGRTYRLMAVGAEFTGRRSAIVVATNNSARRLRARAGKSSDSSSAKRRKR